jgi:tRNA-splicing ligase RtcB
VDEEATLSSWLEDIVEKHRGIERASLRAVNHLGTLGTGNHFIELCLDEEGFLWIMLHSGSRGIGNKIGTYFIEKAKAEMRRWFINLPDEDLAYLAEGTEGFDDYVNAVHWAQEFAAENRRVMMDAVVVVVRRHFPDMALQEKAVNCHHNYVTKEKHYGKNVWLTRKGAVQARSGTLGIIPGSMGVKSFIVRGKGNHESFHSCSHGAGRVMSRGEAIKKITIEQHEADTAGVECKKDASVLDESPKAYKPIDAVMAAQAELVEIVFTLKQVLCVKG